MQRDSPGHNVAQEVWFETDNVHCLLEDRVGKKFAQDWVGNDFLGVYESVRGTVGEQVFNFFGFAIKERVQTRFNDVRSFVTVLE